MSAAQQLTKPINVQLVHANYVFSLGWCFFLKYQATAREFREDGGGGERSAVSQCRRRSVQMVLGWVCFFLSSVDRKTDPLVIVLFKTRARRGRRLNGAKLKSQHGSFNANFVECELRMRRLGEAG